MDAAPVADDVSMDARVHARVVVAVVAVTIVVVVVFWRRRQRYFLFASRSAACAAVRAVSRGNCGFVCICKRVYLQELPGIVLHRDDGPFFRVGRETTWREPAERVFTHTRARATGLAAHECGVKQNAT